MITTLSALTLTDSRHLPAIIGYYNTRQAACQARQSARLYLAHESQPLDDLRNFSSAAMNVLDTCRTAIEKNPAHYVDLRIRSVDDLSDPETTSFTVYYETATGDRHFTVLETITDLAASRIVFHTIPNCKVVVTAFPDEHVETVGYTEVKPEMLDALALHSPSLPRIPSPNLPNWPKPAPSPAASLKPLPAAPSTLPCPMKTPQTSRQPPIPSASPSMKAPQSFFSD